MRRAARTAIAVLASVMCILASAAAAYAQDGAERREFAPTMVVLDASGSMAGADPRGGTKMDAAKRAVRALIEVAPAGATMGLAAYGTGTGNSEAEREQGCQDVTVLSAPAPLDKAAVTEAVDGLAPRGYTPIGRSLQVAAEQLPREGPRSIVLVSDGEDTCAPPEPCDVVRALAGQGVELVVHTVGFGVDEAARTQLSCIAQVTGGTYTDAPDAQALQRVFPRVTTTAMRNYEPAGTPVSGTPTYDTAPVVSPGQYLDTIGQHERRYYAVDVPDGATAYFSAAVSFPRLRGVGLLYDNNSLNLRTFGEGGADCHKFVSEQASGSSGGKALTVVTTWNGATKQKTGSANLDACRGGGRYYFALEWNRVSAGVPARLPVELLVGVEPPVTDPGPVAVLPPVGFVEPVGAPVPVVGGGSFNVAGTLDGSGSYTDTIQRAEFVFYRVRLDWGQALAYRIGFGETPNRHARYTSSVSTRLYTPTREEIVMKSAAYTGGPKQLPGDRSVITTVPVRYNNRNADVVLYRPQSAAGWYYISVHVSQPQADDAPPVPIQLDVSVSGTPEPGPRYAFSSVEAEQAGPFGDGHRLVVEQAVPAPPGETNTVSTAVTPFGWAVLAAVAALVVVLGGFVLRVWERRR